MSDLAPLDYLAVYHACCLGHNRRLIGERYGLTKNAVVGIAHRHPQAIERDNTDLEICRLIDEGFNNGQISRMLTVTEGRITIFRRMLKKTA